VYAGSQNRQSKCRSSAVAKGIVSCRLHLLGGTNWVGCFILLRLGNNPDTFHLDTGAAFV
jgi:hypothetical protein